MTAPHRRYGVDHPGDLFATCPACAAITQSVNTWIADNEQLLDHRLGWSYQVFGHQADDARDHLLIIADITVGPCTVRADQLGGRRWNHDGQICSATTPAHADAYRVRCSGCGVHIPGGLRARDPTEHERVHQTERDRARAISDLWRTVRGSGASR